jgi:hypothetical protein
LVTVKLKPIEEIVKYLNKEWNIGIVGCEIGSSRCKNGGLKEAKELAEALAVNGYAVSLIASPGGTCILERLKRNVLQNIESKCDVVISLACGAGTQVLAENLDIPVITGVDTLFIGAEVDSHTFKEYCIACGDCMISSTGGICPVARCPKSLLNGPCGGAIDGKCEVNPSMPCIWYTIEKKMEELETITSLKLPKPPADYSKSVYPRELKVED